MSEGFVPRQWIPLGIYATSEVGFKVTYLSGMSNFMST